MHEKLTAQRLRELLDYDQETGRFTWKVRTSNRIQVGDQAGTRHGSGYLKIGVDGREYLAHRLAWLYVVGVLPRQQIDHRDGVRTNNMISNLRDVSNAVNGQNRRMPRLNSKSGVLGVSWDKARGKWVAIIQKNGRQINLGRFDSVDAAQCVYLDAKRRLHEGCML